jgi:anaerobic selenocysteine-containing dehydrogenase
MTDDIEETIENPRDNNSRRDFLKLTGAIAGATLVAQALIPNTQAKRNESSGVSENGPKWGMSVDINKCIGCKYCTYACQAVNNLADDGLLCCNN